MRTASYKRTGLALLGMLLITLSTHAETDFDTARKLRESGDILPLETILQKLEKKYPGKVLEVELETKHGKAIYEIELLDTGGKVWELRVNARSGEIIHQHQEDD
jgi:uncharacterized membrane protein YkoI